MLVKNKVSGYIESLIRELNKILKVIDSKKGLLSVRLNRPRGYSS